MLLQALVFTENKNSASYTVYVLIVDHQDLWLCINVQLEIKHGRKTSASNHAHSTQVQFVHGC